MEKPEAEKKKGAAKGMHHNPVRPQLSYYANMVMDRHGEEKIVTYVSMDFSMHLSYEFCRCCYLSQGHWGT